MGRQIIADASLEAYLKTLSLSSKAAIGFIVGQPSKSEKDIVVHFARTDKALKNEHLVDFDSTVVLNHAISLLRMLPGGFYILGVFVICPKDVFGDTVVLSRMKTLFVSLKKTLEANPLLYGETDEYDEGEKLLLHCNSTNQRIVCKNFSNDSSKGPQTKNVDWKFQNKSLGWLQLETFFEINETFMLQKKDAKIDIEENLIGSLNTIKERLVKCRIFFDGEPLANDAALEPKDGKVIHVQVFTPCTKNEKSDLEIRKLNGQTRVTGVISSKIWIPEKSKALNAAMFIKQDILRTLSARIQINCDALVEGEVSEGVTVVNEPPRRVYFNIGQGGIQFSDYIFSTETEETVHKQVKEIMDLELSPTDVFSDIEAVAVNLSEDLNQKLEKKSTSKENFMNVYVFAIFLTVSMLLISILLHFVLK